MRETTRSLSLYFVLCGLSGVLTFLAQAAGLSRHSAGFGSLLVVLGTVNGLLSMCLLYVGLQLKTLLSKRPAFPLRIAKISLVLSCLTLNPIGALFNLYILYQLRLLAREAEIITEQRVLR